MIKLMKLLQAAKHEVSAKPVVALCCATVAGLATPVAAMLLTAVAKFEWGGLSKLGSKLLVSW